jgi:hypothetical protein
MFIGHILYQEKLDGEILIAFFFALFVTSYFSYQYTSANYLIGTINLFPLVAWTAGLVFAREVYKELPFKNNLMRLHLFVLIYLVFLFAVEYIGYYIFQIQLNSNYPDLLGLGILHGPIGMKVFYLSAGPIYVIVSDYLLKDKNKGGLWSGIQKLNHLFFVSFLSTGTKYKSKIIGKR